MQLATTSPSESEFGAQRFNVACENFAHATFHHGKDVLPQYLPCTSPVLPCTSPVLPQYKQTNLRLVVIIGMWLAAAAGILLLLRLVVIIIAPLNNVPIHVISDAFRRTKQILAPTESTERASEGVTLRAPNNFIAAGHARRDQLTWRVINRHGAKDWLRHRWVGIGAKSHTCMHTMHTYKICIHDTWLWPVIIYHVTLCDSLHNHMK